MRLRILTGIGALALSAAIGHAEDADLVTASLPAPIASPSASKPGADIERDAIRQTLDAYRRKSLDIGDGAAALVREPTARVALEWAALRSAGKQAGFKRINAFLVAHPGFPMSSWLRKRAEDALYSDKVDVRTVERFFDGQEPEMATGKLTMAGIARADGRNGAAIRLAREAWRENRMSDELTRAIQRDFADAIGPSDSLYRALRLIYGGEYKEGLRFAEKAGADGLALARALTAVVQEAPNAAALLTALPPNVQKSAAYAFAKAQQLRHDDKIKEAAVVMLAAPRDPDLLIKPDAWWTERRMLARALLDAGDAETAYKVVDGHRAQSDAMRVEAEFHAGWIALRYLYQPAIARRHFERAADSAKTPISIARANYWLGRANEAGGGGDMREAYELAAQNSTTYYGQLALARLGRSTFELPTAQADVEQQASFEAGTAAGVLRVLLDADARDFATPLFLDMAQTLPDAAALDSLGALVSSYRDPRLQLLVGKAAMQRGFALAQHAFPTFGVPDYTAMEGSADKPMVYAIARQESEFNPQAISSAGARGLMQMMPATAQRTAQAFKVDFNADRLTKDPSYNAQLGSAHLGQLLKEQRGSYILTFAAYNAGGGRVKEWIAAYGDPRRPDVDPVDWVERIPISETRNYVQRVMENLQVYRKRLDQRQALLIAEDMRRRN